MLILIKKGMLTEQQLFRVITGLKIKGYLITCNIIYLLFVIICIVYGNAFFPFVRYFNGSDHIIVRYFNGSDHIIVRYFNGSDHIIVRYFNVSDHIIVRYFNGSDHIIVRY